MCFATWLLTIVYPLRTCQPRVYFPFFYFLPEDLRSPFPFEPFEGTFWHFPEGTYLRKIRLAQWPPARRDQRTAFWLGNRPRLVDDESLPTSTVHNLQIKASLEPIKAKFAVPDGQNLLYRAPRRRFDRRNLKSAALVIAHHPSFLLPIAYG